MAFRGHGHAGRSDSARCCPPARSAVPWRNRAVAGGGRGHRGLVAGARPGPVRAGVSRERYRRGGSARADRRGSARARRRLDRPSPPGGSHPSTWGCSLRPRPGRAGTRTRGRASLPPSESWRTGTIAPLPSSSTGRAPPRSCMIPTACGSARKPNCARPCGSPARRRRWHWSCGSRATSPASWPSAATVLAPRPCSDRSMPRSARASRPGISSRLRHCSASSPAEEPAAHSG